MDPLTTKHKLATKHKSRPESSKTLNRNEHMDALALEKDKLEDSKKETGT